MSRAQRKATFMEAAEKMYDALEDWYDEHPEASFEEIEAVAREERRELMGSGLAVLVNGRDSGYQLAGMTCPKCGHAMDYKGEGFRRTIHGLEGATELERAYYVCPNCEGETIFPPR
jgi:DNA-directed RNA polymerase subunit RPC12/RpoP